MTKSFIAASTIGSLKPTLVDNLGGTIKLAKVLSTVPANLIHDVFINENRAYRNSLRDMLLEGYPINEAFRKRSDKYLFGVSVYPEADGTAKASKEIQHFVGSLFKQQLKKEGAKAKFMGIPPSRKLPQLTHVEVIKKQLINESAEILLCISQKRAYLARTEAVHNPFEFQKRDVGRPVQRRIFSIPPRLARIMINLGACTRGKLFLDPFCGVGTILQEALLAGAMVTGLDIDPWCVKSTKTNLEWLKQEYQLTEANFTILHGDARQLSGQIDQGIVDCMATEPDLGPPLRQIPSVPEAMKLATRLLPLFTDLLRESFKVLKKGGRLALVSPYIRTRSQTFGRIPIKEKAEAEGFSVISPLKKERLPQKMQYEGEFSLIEIEERHRIGREIYILQK